MMTVLERAETIGHGFWSLRDRIALVEAEYDETTADAVVGILDDMYARSEGEFMTIRLQTPVQYQPALKMCELIDQIPVSDPRRLEQTLKLLAYVQTSQYDPRMYPIDKDSIEAVNRIISLLERDDPRRTDEALAHIERIEIDPQTERARKNGCYWGNHGYVYHAHRAVGVAAAIKLLPTGSEIQTGAAISHLRYLAGEGADHYSRGNEVDYNFGINRKAASGLIQDMLDLIPADQHQTVIETIAEGQVSKIIEGYEAGETSPVRAAGDLANMLSVLPKGKLDAAESHILILSMAFAQALEERHPLMLAPDDPRRTGRHLAGLWHEVALRTSAQQVTTDRVAADDQRVAFYRQGRTFEFGHAA